MTIVDYDSPVTENENNFKDLNEQIASEGYYGEENSKPLIESDLFEYQRRYYYATSEREKHLAWVDMFHLVKKYSKSLIQKRLKNKIYYIPEEIEEKSAGVSLAFMAQYIDRPGFHVGASFAGTINPKVLEVLYKQNIEDKHKSLNDLINKDSENSFDYLQEKLEFKNIFNQQKVLDPIFRESLSEILRAVIKEFDKTLVNPKQKILVRLWLVLLLKKPKNKHIKLSFKTKCCDFKVNKIIDLFDLELYNRLAAKED